MAQRSQVARENGGKACGFRVGEKMYAGQDSGARRPSRTAVSPHLGAGEKSQQRDSEPELTGPQLLLLSLFFTICRPAVVAVVWVRVHPSRFFFFLNLLVRDF